MTNDTRTSDDIERDIEGERAQMSETINDLQRKFSVDAIVSDLGAMVRGQGGNLGRAVSDTLGRNPAAVVLVGVGLAWLVIGQGRAASGNAKHRQGARASGRRGTAGSSDPWDGTAHAGRTQDGPFRNDDHYWYGDGQMSGDYRAKDRGAKGWAAKASGKADVADGVTGTIRGIANSVGDAVSGAAGRVSDAASDLSERLAHGLDDLSDEAKARVMSARRAAHEARMSSDAVLHRGTRAATGFFEDQPLVVGALAVALGAAIGGALPHSRLEDDTMGDSSDQLYADAQALYRAERDKAMAALRMAANDAKGEMREIRQDLADLVPEGKSVGEVIVDRTSDAASRVINRATGDIEHQDGDKQRS